MTGTTWLLLYAMVRETLGIRFVLTNIIHESLKQFSLGNDLCSWMDDLPDVSSYVAVCYFKFDHRNRNILFLWRKLNLFGEYLLSHLLEEECCNLE